ncbi:vanadium-dependent haloperoxidase [Indibacter alkaliphilus]|nr:vanadium-dependent haloperoxidase [Indibacter alkaliphilus]
MDLRKAKYFILFLLLLSEPLKASDEPTIDLYVDNLFKITEVMVTDVASPPAAARFYAYSTLAAHLAFEIVGGSDDKSKLFSKSSLSVDYSYELNNGIDPHFASVYAMLLVGKKIMPSGYLLDEVIHNLEKEYFKNKKLRKKGLAESKRLGQYAADQILLFAAKDKYAQLSTHTRYTPKKGEGHWYPTPPAYMAAVEPEWRTIQTFFIDDLQGYKPLPPANFSLEENSSFQKQLMEVYQVTSALTDEQKLIANFWDCNPFMVQYSGHMAIGIKKISPGGHWIGITGIAAQKATLSWSETLFIHALVSMGLHDAFISCWEEKYDSDRIRPESAINKYVDKSWKPLLQTPPFPEYTSGHSVISSASAVILTDYFGENFDFLDTSEVYFGLPERYFNSFQEAAEEAAISRLYGGIHFRDAIEEGVIQGKSIGEYILSLIKNAS